MDDTTTTASTTAEAGDAPPAEPAGAGRPTKATFESLAVASLVFGFFAIVISLFALGLATQAASSGLGYDDDGGGDTTSATPAEPSGDAPASIDIEMAEFAYTPSEGSVAVDGVINLTNHGSLQHDLVIDGLDSGMIDPGADGVLELKDFEPGEYQFWCTVPGHRDAGMEGTLVLE